MAKIDELKALIERDVVLATRKQPKASSESSIESVDVEVKSTNNIDGLETFVQAPKKYECLQFSNVIEFAYAIHPALKQGFQKLYPWQIWALMFLTDPKWSAKNRLETYIVAANGAGKDSYIIALSALYLITCTPRHRVVITTNDTKQMMGQTYPHLKSLSEYLNEWMRQVNPGLIDDFVTYKYGYIACAKTGGDAVMFVTDEPGRAEGYHPAVDHPNAQLSIIVNEGKNIKKDIYNALYRCRGYSRYVVVSSAGFETGYFYEQVQAALRYPAPYKEGCVYTRIITSYDCPGHIDEATIEADRKRLEPWLFASTHLSEFSSIGGQFAIPSYLLKHPPDTVYENKHKDVYEAGLDLALGGDKCVLKVRKGFEEIYTNSWRIDNTVKLEQTIAVDLLALNLPATTRINVDVGGIGKPIFQHLVGMVPIVWVPITNQSKAHSKLFRNSIAEDYFHVRTLLLKRLIPPPKDPLLVAQLTSRRFEVNDGKISLEEKKDARARGEKSPDEADSYVNAYRRYRFDELNKITTAKPNVVAADKAFDLSKTSEREMFLRAQELALNTKKTSHNRLSMHDIIKYTYGTN
jgi:hypothetical protein